MTDTFSCPQWEEATYAEVDGVKLAHAKATYSYRGRLDGEGSTNLLLTYLPDGTGTYVASELFTGRVDGREGSVVFQHSGTFDAAGIDDSWTVAPGSGTGGLSGLTGTGRVGMTTGTDSSTYTFTS